MTKELKSNDNIMEYYNDNNTPILITMHYRRQRMKLTEFIEDFVETHEIQSIDKINGTIITSITSEEYLVSKKEVSQK